MTESQIETVAAALYAYATGGMDWKGATEITRGKMIGFASAGLAALRPAGWVVVPVVATDAMAEELWQAQSERVAGRRRLTQWADESEETHEQWRFLARSVVALQAAT